MMFRSSKQTDDDSRTCPRPPLRWVSFGKEIFGILNEEFYRRREIEEAGRIFGNRRSKVLLFPNFLAKTGNPNWTDAAGFWWAQKKLQGTLIRWRPCHTFWAARDRVTRCRVTASWFICFQLDLKLSKHLFCVCVHHGLKSRCSQVRVWMACNAALFNSISFKGVRWSSFRWKYERQGRVVG